MRLSDPFKKRISGSPIISPSRMTEAVILYVGPTPVKHARVARRKPRPGNWQSGRVATATGRDHSGALLTTGAEVRLTNGRRDRVVVCVNGGQGGEVAGTWSATIEWLVSRLAPNLPDVGFAEVRYRIKSWRQFDLCVEDARAAVREVGGQRTLLLGFSMGGAVAIATADEPAVERIVGLAPWVPDRLAVETLGGKPFDVLQGSFDRYLPGIPGVTPASSRRGFERARALGSPGTYTLIRAGLHGVAVRIPGGVLVPLPRAGRWLRLLAALLDGFADETSASTLHLGR
jgi:pimeloyl-ACP methyl ester carboxylesterase